METKYQTKVIISVRGTKGDVYPMLAIAAELKLRKISVVFLANDFFKDLITNCGIEFCSIGTVDEYISDNSDPRMWSPNEDMDKVNIEGSLLSHLERAFNEVSERFAGNSDIFVISIGARCGARLAAKKFSIPHAVLVLQPAGIFSIDSPAAPLCWEISPWIPNRLAFLIRKLNKSFRGIFSSIPEHIIKLNTLYMTLGVYEEERKLRMNYPRADVLIGLFPSWFARPAKDWPKKMKLVGFPVRAESDGCDSTVVDQFIEEKGSPILFTSGTGVHDKSDMFRSGVKICEILGKPGIFVGGKLGKAFPESSNICIHVDYVNFASVFPRCLAVVHHGGIGTMVQAIKAKVPQLIRPLKIDQPDNANRIQNLGLGSFILPENFEVDVAACMLDQLIRQSSENPALQEYSRRLSDDDAIDTACNMIEEKLATLAECASK